MGFVAEIVQVLYDLRAVSEREIAATFSRAGYPATVVGATPPSAREAEGAHRAAVGLVLLAQVGVVYVVSRTHATTAGMAWARLALCVGLGVLAAGPTLRLLRLARRRGTLASEIVPVAAAAAAFALGCLELLAAVLPGNAPATLARLGFRADAWRSSAPVGFETAAVVLATILVSRALEHLLRDRALAGLAARARARARTARRLACDDREEPIACEAVSVGDRLRLVEGDETPADVMLEVPARVLEPTPEGSHAVAERAAQHVVAKGSVLLSAWATCRVVRPPEDPFEAALDAETHRSVTRIDVASTHAAAPSRGAEVAAQSLALAAVAFATFVAAIHAVRGGGPLSLTAWTTAVAVLAAASPAVLLLASRNARACAVLRAREDGVVVKDAWALDAIASADTACFAATGTVTNQDLHVVDVRWLAGAQPDQRLLSAVAAIERGSVHPAGQAIARYLSRNGTLGPALGPEIAVTQTGDGISAKIADRVVEVGSSRRFRNPDASGLPAEARLVWFGQNGRPLGCFVLDETMRADAEPTMRRLEQEGFACWLLSGDRLETTAALARRLGLPALSGLTPAEKALAVRNLQHEGRRVLLVGDGRFDTACAAVADAAISVAPGTLPGSALAPVVVAVPELSPVPRLVRLARLTRAAVRRGTLACVVHAAIATPLAALGWLGPLRAAIVLACATLLVAGGTLAILAASPSRDSHVARAALRLRHTRMRLSFSSLARLFLVVSLAAAPGAGCIAGDAAEATDVPGGVPGPDATIAFEQSGTVELALGETRGLTLRTDPPAPYEVTFALLGDALDATLDHVKAVAGPDGRASVEVRGPNAPTTFRVRASIEQGPSTEMAVAVSDQGFGSVRVVPVYAGTRDVTEWTASVVARTTCESIAPELPGEPEGALVASAEAPGEPLVASAPVGPKLAVAVRSGHYMWGCTDATTGLVAGGSLDVKVNVFDKPIDLSQTDHGVVLTLVPEPDGYAELVAKVAALVADTFLPPDVPESTALLDAMQELLPDAEAEAFATKRALFDWDGQIESGFFAAGLSLREVVIALVQAGAPEKTMELSGRLRAFEMRAPGYARLSVDSFDGVAADDAGIPPEHLVSWSSEANDTVLLGATVFWVPTRFLGASAFGPAKAAVPSADTMGDALAGLAACDQIGALLGGFGTCGESCIEGLCRGALAARWELSLDASAEAAQIGTIGITATAHAAVDDEAAPTSFDGVWVGTIGATDDVVPASGAIAGAREEEAAGAEKAIGDRP